MNQPKTDRRINRTRRLLREALMVLILEKGYDNLTIEEITNRAELGRTTFYLHYRDKEELLLESIETIAEDLRAQVETLIGNQSESSYNNAVLFVFQQAAVNAPLYRIILSGGAATSVLTRIREILSEAAQEFFERRFPQATTAQSSPLFVPPDVIAHAFATSMLGLMTWWLEQGMQYTPEQISQYFRILFFTGALSALEGLDLDLTKYQQTS